MRLNCDKFLFSAHALKVMFERNIQAVDVLETIKNGTLIKEYENDKPYPSSIYLKFVNERPIHVLVAQNSMDNVCIIVTCYEPDELLWDINFKNKIK